MAGVRNIAIKPEDDGLRLDRWFRKYFPALTQGRLEKLLRRGLVRLDGKRVKAAARLISGQTMRVPPEVPAQGASRSSRPISVPDDLVAQLEAAILHRDKHIMVLNKPSGLAVQGGSKTERHIDAALPGLQFDEAEPPRLVHRLDRDTSGVLVLARNRKAAQFLTRQFAGRDVEKSIGLWFTVCRVRPKGTLTCRWPSAAGDGGERVRPVDKKDPDAMKASTDLLKLPVSANAFAGWLSPLTGRTHQIRAHAAAIGHPLVGDGKYRMDDENQEYGGILPKKLHLHARSIMMPHPKVDSFSASTVDRPYGGNMGYAQFRFTGCERPV